MDDDNYDFFSSRAKTSLLYVHEPIHTEAYKGHCVLCKDVLSFVFQTFDFQVLCFGFCVLCPVFCVPAR